MIAVLRNGDVKTNVWWLLLLLTTACAGVTPQRSLLEADAKENRERVLQPRWRFGSKDPLPEKFFNTNQCQWDYRTGECKMSTPLKASFFTRIGDRAMQDLAFSLEDCQRIIDSEECGGTPACQWFFSACSTKLFSPDYLVRCYGGAATALLQVCNKNDVPKTCNETAGCTWPDKNGFRRGCVFEASDFLEHVAEGRFEGDLEVQLEISKLELGRLKKASSIGCKATPQENCFKMCEWKSNGCHLRGAAILKEAKIKRPRGGPKACELIDFVLLGGCMGRNKRDCRDKKPDGMQCTWAEAHGCVPSPESVFKHIMDESPTAYLGPAQAASSRQIFKEFAAMALRCSNTSDEICKGGKA
ncbi:hypothetical protein BSKO_01483 [Bryopsis sp. KO-2023]|nr:hypothetical protein BSKO_01483 [Bryopsis sp. KO-2023]